MAIRTVVTSGFGNGTFNGTVALVVVRGYAAAVVAAGRILRNNPMMVTLGKMMNR